jgi:hypothetical protein
MIKYVDISLSILYSFVYSILVFSSSHKIDLIDWYTVGSLLLVLICPITAFINAAKNLFFKSLTVVNIAIAVCLIVLSYQMPDWSGFKTFSILAFVKLFRLLTEN